MPKVPLFPTQIKMFSRFLSFSLLFSFKQSKLFSFRHNCCLPQRPHITALIEAIFGVLCRGSQSPHYDFHATRNGIFLISIMCTPPIRGYCAVNNSSQVLRGLSFADKFHKENSRSRRLAKRDLDEWKVQRQLTSS